MNLRKDHYRKKNTWLLPCESTNSYARLSKSRTASFGRRGLRIGPDSIRSACQEPNALILWRGRDKLCLGYPSSSSVIRFKAGFLCTPPQMSRLLIFFPSNYEKQTHVGLWGSPHSDKAVRRFLLPATRPSRKSVKLL